MNVAVVGSGYVGLVTGACFSEFGVHVTCVDKDDEKIARLRSGHVPIYEPGLEELIQKNMRAGRLLFTTDLASAVCEALVIFIAVGTPPRGDGSTDLSYIENVAAAIGDMMKDYKVIVTKSTVPVGTGKKIRQMICARLKERVQFDIVSNPEFLREGSAIEDFMRPNRVVIGTDSPQAIAIMQDLYRPLYLRATPLVVTDTATAEMIKYASNTYLAVKISFINEMARLCEQVGADIQDVAKGMGLDGRIGPKFLHPGPGFGGSCLPKDVLSLASIAQQNGYDFKIARTVLEVNRHQKEWMVEKIEKAIESVGGGVSGKRIGILGLSFKPNTDDMREAPAITIIQALQKKGAILVAYDPAAISEAQKVFSDIEYAQDPYGAAEGADAIVLMTEWNMFRNLDLQEIKRKLKSPVFIDLRNVYDPKMMTGLGFHYTSVGRHTL